MENKNAKGFRVNQIISTTIFILIFALLLLIALILIVLMCFGIGTSLRTVLDYMNKSYAPPTGWPWEWAWDNYKTAFENIKVPIEGTTYEVYFLEQLFWSFIYAPSMAFCTAFVPCWTAYLCAKFQYKFSSFVYYLVIFTLGICVVGSLPSQMALMDALGFKDSIIGVIIMSSTFTGTHFLIFYGVLSGVSNSFYDAAEIDGASNIRLFFNIAFPLVKITFWTMVLLKFISYWNGYQTVMLFLPSFPTAAYGIWYFNGSAGTGTSFQPIKLAGNIVLMLPVVILFLCFRNKFIGNISMGGVKE